MDAFFASVEQNDHPELKGKPIAVGGSAARGVVAAASYEARKYGVFSAMASVKAARLCPQLIFVKPRFGRYKEVSQMIQSIFHDYTDLVEPLSLDEAYLDVTSTKKGPPSATLIALAIKKEIKELTGLTASAGVSYNKFLAKTASDIRKPDGLFVILPENALEFLEKLPIKKFHGIGPVTEQKMKIAGIFTGADLKQKSKEDLILRYGKSGNFYYQIVRGIDNRPVSAARETKSINAETTYAIDLESPADVLDKLNPLIVELINRCQHKSIYGRTVTLKIKFNDFEQITRSKTYENQILNSVQLKECIFNLWQDEYLIEKKIRLLGLGISNFPSEISTVERQLVLNF